MLLWALLASGQIPMNKVDGWAAVFQPIPLDSPAWFGNNHVAGFAGTGPSLTHHSTAVDGNNLAIHLQDVARNDTHR